MPLTVGFAGLGRMGTPMARNVGRAGFELVLYNRTRAKAEKLAGELGARVAQTPRELAAAADVVVTMLADQAAIDAIYQGPDGIVAGLGGAGQAGKVVVEMSTIGPAAVAELAGAVRAAGAELVDAPVSGSVSLAAAGELTIMAGGPEEALARVQPVLEAIGKRVFHLGGTGTGAAMKLAVNNVIYGLTEAVAEGLVLAERAGIERARAYEVFANSAAAAPAVLYRRPQFEQPGSHPVSFSLDLAAKDLRLILALAERVGAPMPQAERNLEVMEGASAAGHGDEDLAAVALYLRESTGR